MYLEGTTLAELLREQGRLDVPPTRGCHDHRRVERHRHRRQDLRDEGDLSPPTFNRLRRAVDSLEAAIIAVL
jgi:hypothetical protein